MNVLRHNCVCDNCGIAYSDDIAVTPSTPMFAGRYITFCRVCRNLSANERGVYARVLCRRIDRRAITERDIKAIAKSERLQRALGRKGE